MAIWNYFPPCPVEAAGTRHMNRRIGSMTGASHPKDYERSDVDPRLVGLLAAGAAVFLIAVPFLLAAIYPGSQHRGGIEGNLPAAAGAAVCRPTSAANCNISRPARTSASKASAGPGPPANSRACRSIRRCRFWSAAACPAGRRRPCPTIPRNAERRGRGPSCGELDSVLAARGDRPCRRCRPAVRRPADVERVCSAAAVLSAAALRHPLPRRQSRCRPRSSRSEELVLGGRPGPPSTLVAFLGLFVWGAQLYLNLYDAPKDAVPIYVVAKQWMWKVQHLGGQREINELHVPVGRSVRLIMASQDVIHSLLHSGVPHQARRGAGHLRGHLVPAAQAGVFQLFCAEYCGTDHSRMTGRIVVMEPAAFEQWLAHQDVDWHAGVGRRRPVPRARLRRLPRRRFDGARAGAGGAVRQAGAVERRHHRDRRRALHPRFHPETTVAGRGGLSGR